MCYTKETPNLLRDTLNILLLLGTRKSAPVSLSVLVMGAVQNWSAGLHPISLLVFRENQRDHDGKERACGLAARWKEGLDGFS